MIDLVRRGILRAASGWPWGEFSWLWYIFFCRIRYPPEYLGEGVGWLVEWGPLHPQRSRPGVADMFRTVPQGLCSTRCFVRGRRCGAVGNRWTGLFIWISMKILLGYAASSAYKYIPDKKQNILQEQRFKFVYRMLQIYSYKFI